jgi:hypothetical protein
MYKENQPNVNSSNNNQKSINQKKEFVPDSEDADINYIEIVQKQKKIKTKKNQKIKKEL